MNEHSRQPQTRITLAEKVFYFYGLTWNVYPTLERICLSLTSIIVFRENLFKELMLYGVHDTRNNGAQEVICSIFRSQPSWCSCSWLSFSSQWWDYFLNKKIYKNRWTENQRKKLLLICFLFLFLKIFLCALKLFHHALAPYIIFSNPRCMNEYTGCRYPMNTTPLQYYWICFRSSQVYLYLLAFCVITPLFQWFENDLLSLFQRYNWAHLILISIFIIKNQALHLFWSHNSPWSSSAREPVLLLYPIPCQTALIIFLCNLARNSKIRTYRLLYIS